MGPISEHLMCMAEDRLGSLWLDVSLDLLQVWEKGVSQPLHLFAERQVKAAF